MYKKCMAGISIGLILAVLLFINILQNNNVNAITDDFKICDSWVE